MEQRHRELVILVCVMLAGVASCRRSTPILRLVIPSTLEGNVTLVHDPRMPVLSQREGDNRVYVVVVKPESLAANLSPLDDWHILEVIDDAGRPFYTTSGWDEKPLLPFQLNVGTRNGSGNLRVRIRRE